MPLSKSELQPIISYIRDLKQKRDRLDAEIKNAEMGLAAFTRVPSTNRMSSATATTTNGHAKAKVATKGKRIRRSPEQLKSEAAKVYALVTKAGNKGVSGGEIRAASPKIGIDIKSFMKKWGKPLKTKGEKAQMRYFVD